MVNSVDPTKKAIYDRNGNPVGYLCNKCNTFFLHANIDKDFLQHILDAPIEHGIADNVFTDDNGAYISYITEFLESFIQKHSDATSMYNINSLANAYHERNTYSLVFFLVRILNDISEFLETDSDDSVFGF